MLISNALSSSLFVAHISHRLECLASSLSNEQLLHSHDLRACCTRWFGSRSALSGVGGAALGRPVPQHSQTHACFYVLTTVQVLQTHSLERSFCGEAESFVTVSY